jgi:hypothetical protein
MLSDEDDGGAYDFDAPPDRPCPGCARALPVDAVVCPSCGFDQHKGKRRRKSYEPVERAWEAGWPLERRKRLFVIGQVVAVPLSALGAWGVGAWTAFLLPWLVFSVVTAFLLGTYARTDLNRNERGKVRLTHTGRVCFFVRPTEAIPRSGYDGVVSGKAPGPDFWDYVAMIILLLAGIVLGVLWWYFVIRSDSFFVALTRDHGFPERTLYWGWDQRQADDMANTLRTVAFGTT